MQPRPRTLLVILFLVAILTVSFFVFVRNCPSSGIALTPRARYLHRLKNRTSIPATTDFDSRITLEAMLQPGDDRERWSNDRAARIQGEVIDVAYARPEATNCFSPCRRDIHILVATHKGAAQSEHVVVEVTPNFQSESCSEDSLPKQLVGHWCEFEGWLYFDAGHAEESENISPRKPDNWRATAWEIHPVTKFRVIR